MFHGGGLKLGVPAVPLIKRWFPSVLAVVGVEAGGREGRPCVSSRHTGSLFVTGDCFPSVIQRYKDSQWVSHLLCGHFIRRSSSSSSSSMGLFMYGCVRAASRSHARRAFGVAALQAALQLSRCCQGEAASSRLIEG